MFAAQTKPRSRSVHSPSLEALEPLKQNDLEKDRKWPRCLNNSFFISNVSRRPGNTALIVIGVIVMLCILNSIFAWNRAGVGEQDVPLSVAKGAAAKKPIIQDILKFIRINGKWEDKIYVLTDATDDLNNMRNDVEFDIIEVELQSNGVSTHRQASILKCELLDKLPTSVGTALYMDTDIVVTKDLHPFLDHMMEVISKPGTNVGLFEDMGGHALGHCKGCDKWHSGIIALVRERSEPCMNAWCEDIRSSDELDQVSLEKVDSEHQCKGIGRLDKHYLHFARDYLNVFRSPTFVHYTYLLNPDRWNIPRRGVQSTSLSSSRVPWPDISS